MTAHQPGEPKQTGESPLRKNSLKGVRLRKHADYQKAYTAAARKRQSASMSWFLAPRPTVEQAANKPAGYAAPVILGPRVGLTAGKVLGKAHERNRIKRRMREALRRHVDLLPQNADLILHPRRVVIEMEFGKLEAEVVRILMQARAELARAEAQSRTESLRAEAQKAEESKPR